MSYGGLDCSRILFIKQLRFVKEKSKKKPLSPRFLSCREQTLSAATVLRGGSGRSDSEASARKAQMAASAELAAILAKTVESTTEEYSRRFLSEGMSSESKSLLTDKTKITVNQTWHGATIEPDRWDKDEKTGQFGQLYRSGTQKETIT